MQYSTLDLQPYTFNPAMPAFAQGGLASAAQAVQAKGRGNDTILVHMTPNEVKGLQALAVAQGGSLTINPDTGLPEAGILDAILPIVAGFALGPAGFALMSAPMAALTVGGVTALATGDLGKGLMAGLGAYGGANFGSALSATGADKLSQAALPEAGMSVLPTAGEQAAGQSLLAQSISGAPGMSAVPGATGSSLLQAAGTQMAPSVAAMTPSQVAALQVPPSFSTVGAGVQDLASSGGFSRFGQAFLDSSGGNFGATAGGFGMAAPILGSMDQQYEFPTTPLEESKYAGPYRPTEREVRYPVTDEERRSSREFSYFTPTNPYPGFYGAASGGQIKGYQEGGEVDERAVRMPPEVAPAGQEFDYNFRPVEIAQPTPTPAELTSPISKMFSRMFRGKGGRLSGGESDIVGYTGSGEPIYSSNPTTSAFGKGARSTKSSGPAGMSAEDAKKYGYDKYKDLSGYQYNPRTQRLEKMAAGGLAALAAGGELLEDGSFVIDARTVAEIGNGSSEAGQELLAQLGGRPVKGPGDGVSDSIPATIEGEQAAAVARDEVIFDPESVAAIGEGDMDEGARRLYALMNEVSKARKTAKRGEDSGAGLAALSAAGAV
jgi:hypothetical protein